MSKAFKFPLEALKKHRAHRLSVAKREFMQVENKIVDLTTKLKEMLTESKSLSTEEALFSGGTQNLGAQAMLFEMQKKRIHQTGLSILDSEEELEKNRRWLAEMNKEMKALEKLEEKMRGRWEEDRKKKEQKQGDAWVAIHWSRQNRKEEEA